MSTNYFIGVNDAEVDRLHMQHEAWRPETELLWKDAGFSSCRSILDLAAVPGLRASISRESSDPPGRSAPSTRRTATCNRSSSVLARWA